MDHLKNKLLEGEVYPDLSLYSSLWSDYGQIIKLLLPDCDIDIDVDKFSIFTINETIYNLASEIYEIEDTYKNAHSIWFLDRLKSKGIYPTLGETFLLLEGPPGFVDYVVKNKYLDIFSIVNHAVLNDLEDVLVYAIENGYKDIVFGYMELNEKYDMIKLLDKPRVANLRSYRYALRHKDVRLLNFLVRALSIDIDELITEFDEADWLVGVRIIVQNNKICINNVMTALDYCSDKVLKMVYLKSIKDGVKPVGLIDTLMKDGLYTYAKLIYDLHPVDLKNICLTNVTKNTVLTMISMDYKFTQKYLKKAIKYKLDKRTVHLITNNLRT